MAPDSALAIADAALFRRITTSERLQEELLRRRGRPGIPIARLVIERADPGGRNWFESSSRWWLLEAGLPRPELQVCFTDQRGQIRAEVDMWFAVEVIRWVPGEMRTPRGRHEVVNRFVRGFRRRS